jgi:tRNA A-37 threonylcarbamoyl transferase component Bud32
VNNRRAQSFETGPVVFERSGAFRCYYDAEVSKDIVKEFLQPDPDDLFERGEQVSSGRSGNPRDLAKVLVKGKWFFLKRYNCQGRFYRIKNMFRLSRGRRAMRAGRWLLNSGVPTPKPLICLEERHGRMLGRSYLICPFLEGSRSLFDLWPDLDADRKRLYMQRLGRLMGTLHRSGIVHGDSNWRNILVGKGQAEELRFWFVDLDGVRRYRRLTAARAERDIGHFLRELKRNGADEEYARLFRRHWQRTLNLN